MLKRNSSAGTKAYSDMKPMAPTSRPTIGTTIVVGSQYAENSISSMSTASNSSPSLNINETLTLA